MKVKKLDLSNSDEVRFVENLYVESFPKSERRPVKRMLDLYVNDNSPFTIIVAVENERLVGFFTYWDLKDFIFAEHFAISPEFRNGGFGRKVMDSFIKETTIPIILEVELPTTILSERRIGFYQRIGFRLWEDIQYHQPAYNEEDGAIPMKLMTLGDIDLDKNLTEIRSKIYSVVYNC